MARLDDLPVCLRRWLWAGLVGAGAVALGLVELFMNRTGEERATFLVGYWMWLASMVLLVAIGAVGWRTVGRGLKSTTMPVGEATDHATDHLKDHAMKQSRLRLLACTILFGVTLAAVGCSLPQQPASFARP